ncbi:gluconokinase [Oceaniglobus ichthyenteri]|uniref:gluconokinase n=1 Tax=Oceaniglobus ichthyenteri TaxID=2136177 RepID=UPI00197CF8E3|nr:gluconokinase [Oceaniglobus ichthyenteri]
MDRYVVMGVSGCGKSVIGALLAERMGATYIDGDDLHPASNVAKMAAGTALTDEDRAPWLDQVGATLGAAQGVAIIGCSALKRIYRDRIRAAAGQDVMFLHLSGDKTLIAGRMGARTGHFMPTSLLDSQFEALEPPTSDETALSVDIGPDPAVIVSNILAQLGPKDR